MQASDMTPQTSTLQVSKPEKKLTGWHVFFALFAFFGVVFAVNFFMAYSAIGTFSGVVSEQPYEEGRTYNRQIVAARAQDALGWHMQLALTPTTLNVGLVVPMPAHEAGASDIQPALPAGFKAVAELRRPATKRFDMRVPLSLVAMRPANADASPANEGADMAAYDFQATFDAPLPTGRWLVSVTILDAADAVIFRRDFKPDFYTQAAS